MVERVCVLKTWHQRNTSSKLEVKGCTDEKNRTSRIQPRTHRRRSGGAQWRGGVRDSFLRGERTHHELAKRRQSTPLSARSIAAGIHYQGRAAPRIAARVDQN